MLPIIVKNMPFLAISRNFVPSSLDFSLQQILKLVEAQTFAKVNIMPINTFLSLLNEA